MNLRLVADLVCPLCSNPLVLDGGPQPQVDTAELICTGCGLRFLVPPGLHSHWARPAGRSSGLPSVKTADCVRLAVAALRRAGTPSSKHSFSSWMHPIGSHFLRKKASSGRRVRHRTSRPISQRRGELREVIALDLSAAVEDGTSGTLRSFRELADVIQGDLLRPPLRTAAERRRIRLRVLDRCVASPPRPVRGVPVPCSHM